MNGKRLVTGFITIVLFSLIGYAITYTQVKTIPTCIAKRAAFDIGSGTTKMTVALVDTCRHTILKVLGEAKEKVPYKSDLSASKDRKFSQEIIDRGMKVLTTFKAQAVSLGAKTFAAVATSAFRHARNPKIFLERAYRELGLRIKIISQQDEGEIGYYGAAGKVKNNGKPLVVWDIGGGSMQLSASISEKLSVHKGSLASVTFKDYILKHIQRKETRATPNPIFQSDAAAALEHAKAHALKTTSQDLKAKLSNSEILGIGGVHYYSIRNQVNSDSKSFTQKEVRDTLHRRLGLSDEAIGSKYASTEISNLILVLGYMEALNIQKVNVAKVNMTDGILVNPTYWKSNL